MRHLKIETLPSSKHWVDADIVMLHACFQLLKDVVEKEKILEFINKEYHKKYYDEVLFLYEWWGKKAESDYEDDQEADEMLSRLIKIRNFLWT